VEDGNEILGGTPRRLLVLMLRRLHGVDLRRNHANNALGGVGVVSRSVLVGRVANELGSLVGGGRVDGGGDGRSGGFVEGDFGGDEGGEGALGAGGGVGFFFGGGVGDFGGGRKPRRSEWRV